MAGRKVDFARKVREVVTAWAEVTEHIAELDSIYDDSDYAPGEADEIVPDDLTGHDITVTNLSNASTFATALAVFAAPYMSAINAFRNM